MENIVILQLINGENIIGEVVETSEETLEIKYPMSLVMDPASGGLGMIPYQAIYTGNMKEDKIFSKGHIMDVLDTEDITNEIIEKYNEFKNSILEAEAKEKTENPKQETLPGL